MRTFLAQLTSTVQASPLSLTTTRTTLGHGQLHALPHVVFADVSRVRAGQPEGDLVLARTKAPDVVVHVLPHPHGGRVAVQNVARRLRVNDAVPVPNMFYLRIGTEAPARPIGHVGNASPDPPEANTAVRALPANLANLNPVGVGRLGSRLLVAEREGPGAAVEVGRDHELLGTVGCVAALHPHLPLDPVHTSTGHRVLEDINRNAVLVLVGAGSIDLAGRRGGVALRTRR